jgi:hypothetical protein
MPFETPNPKFIRGVQDLRELESIAATFDKWFRACMDERAVPMFMFALTGENDKKGSMIKVLSNLRDNDNGKKKLKVLLEEMLKELNQGKEIIIVQ